MLGLHGLRSDSRGASLGLRLSTGRWHADQVDDNQSFEQQQLTEDLPSTSLKIRSSRRFAQVVSSILLGSVKRFKELDKDLTQEVSGALSCRTLIS